MFCLGVYIINNVSNLKIFETNLLDGPMRLKYEYFTEITGGVSKRKITDAMTEEMRDEFLASRINAGFKYGFDGKKIVVPYEAYGRYQRGHYFVADDNVFSMDEDLWNVDIPGDIVILKEDNPGMVVAYPVSDEPVVIVEDPKNGACALTHCSLERITKEMPCLAVDALVKEVGSNVADLKVYISSNLKKDNYISLVKPSCIDKNRKVWKDCIKRGSVSKINKNANLGQKALNNLLSCFKYSIDQEKAIYNMLVKKGVLPLNITISDIDTYIDPVYYSSAAEANFGLGSKNGKFLVGAYYDNTFPSLNGTVHVRSL